MPSQPMFRGAPTSTQKMWGLFAPEDFKTAYLVARGVVGLLRFRTRLQ
jgi:hypothetical protein